MFSSPEEAITASPPPTGKLGLTIPDNTRPVQVSRALKVLREAIAGEPPVVVGLGLHRPMRAEELPESPFRLLQHNPDDTFTTAIFEDAIGRVPGGISQHFAGVDGILSLGIVELHQYAGFSGGHKGVSVGCGARATLDALHHRDRVTAPGVLLGNLENNPFRQPVDSLGKAAGCVWALVQAEGRWLAGEPGVVVREAAASLQCWEEVEERYSAAVLKVPAQKGVNFYQASRAVTYLGLSPRPPLIEGATLFLEAACPEGLGQGPGEEAFARTLASVPAPWEQLLSGPAPAGAGAQRAIMLALLLRRFRLVLCGLHDPTPFLALGFEASSLPAAALAPAAALQIPNPFIRLPRIPERH